MKIPELRNGCIGLVPRGGLVFGLGELFSPPAGGLVAGLAYIGNRVFYPETEVSWEQLTAAGTGLYVLAKIAAFSAAAIFVHKNEAMAARLIKSSEEKRRQLISKFFRRGHS